MTHSILFASIVSAQRRIANSAVALTWRNDNMKMIGHQDRR
jgi:hypothetical protein